MNILMMTNTYLPHIGGVARSVETFAGFYQKLGHQVMVITEAMAAAVPMIVLDGPGVREVVPDGENGFLLKTNSLSQYVATINDYKNLPERKKIDFRCCAQATACDYDSPKKASNALMIYQSLLYSRTNPKHPNRHLWEGLLPLIRPEWDIVKSYANCASGAILRRSSPAEVELGVY